jgi:methionine-rich copper-binding protein CopC
MTIDMTLPERELVPLRAVRPGQKAFRPHAGLVRSDPSDGGTVGIGRSELTLWFGEPVDPGQSSYELHEAGGAPVEVTVGPPGPDGGRVVELSTAPLTTGTFVLDWHAITLDDGHPTSGSVVFGVGGRPMGVVSSATGLPQGPGLFLRWLGLS